MARVSHPSGCAAPPIGAILAGGTASRLGGGHKSLLQVGGRPVLARVADVLRAGCASVVLNANGDPAAFAAFALPVVADTLPGRLGPLAGVLAAMDWAAATRPEASHVATAPGDTPFLPADYVARLVAALGATGATIACARSGAARHPVAALWPVGLRHALRRALVEDDVRKVGLFLARHEVVDVDWTVAPFDPFFNVNTPDDLAAAEAIAARLGL